LQITYHPAKRAWTLQNRGLDFEDAALVFSGEHADLVDDRFDYGELRIQTFGHLRDMTVMVAWTQRGNARHVMSMRRCHAKEAHQVRQRLHRP
jgi:uncharacterized DUF497 family protein